MDYSKVTRDLPDLVNMKGQFESKFGGSIKYTSEYLVASAPGRVNLIGEHTDYSEGFVFPCGLSRRVGMVLKARSDSVIRVWAMDINQLGQADLKTAALERKSEMPGFLQFGCGVGVQLRDALSPGTPIYGFDAVLSSTIPIGGGVSSSSALAVATGSALRAINPAIQKQLSWSKFFNCICEGEWQWSGVRGGIMDQYTSLNAEQDYAFVLDCRKFF